MTNEQLNNIHLILSDLGKAIKEIRQTVTNIDTRLTTLEKYVNTELTPIVNESILT